MSTSARSPINKIDTKNPQDESIVSETSSEEESDEESGGEENEAIGGEKNCENGAKNTCKKSNAMDDDATSSEDEEGEKLPPQSEMSMFDVQEVAVHIAMQKAEEGKRRLTSTVEGLAMAIRYSYELYSFGDVSGFPTDAPGGDGDDDDDVDNEGETDDEEEGMEAEEAEDVVLFPSLPRDAVSEITKRLAIKGGVAAKMSSRLVPLANS